MSNNREELLLRMYDQLVNEISRHIMIVWQSISVVVGAFAIFTLVEKKVVSLDIASAIIILLVTWLIAHIYDAAYWYNRNLTIIANIERQFLQKEDLRNIHYYWGRHRPVNSMLTHLNIQYAFGVGLGCLVLLYHFIERVVLGFKAPITNFDMLRVLPYALTLVCVIYLLWLRKKRHDSYKEFLENSPGIEVDTTGIKYGVGHGYKNRNKGELTNRST